MIPPLPKISEVIANTDTLLMSDVLKGRLPAFDQIDVAPQPQMIENQSQQDSMFVVISYVLNDSENKASYGIFREYDKNTREETIAVSFRSDFTSAIEFCQNSDHNIKFCTIEFHMGEKIIHAYELKDVTSMSLNVCDVNVEEQLCTLSVKFSFK